MSDQGATGSGDPDTARTDAADGDGGEALRGRRRTRAALEAMRVLLRDAYLRRFGAPPSGAGPFDLTLSVRVDPSANWAVELSPPLEDQVGPRFDELQARLDIYRPGRVYSFRAETSEAAECSPPEPDAVFAGYDATGRPEWLAFHQALLDGGFDGVDRLYGTPPRVVARVQYGRDLRERQLASFGRSSRTYALLGQVVAGYFPLPAPGRREPLRAALTAQVVECRDAAGRFRLCLNLLGCDPSGRTPGERFAEGWEPALDRALRIAARAVAGLERQVIERRSAGDPPGANRALARIPAILRRLADAIERGDGQKQRRTRHAELRRRERRPVPKAVEDLRRAGPERVFMDEKAGTLIVLGARGRSHAFSDAGRHVTSFALRDDAVQHRLRTGRWRPLEPREWQAFRANTAALYEPGRTPAEGEPT